MFGIRQNVWYFFQSQNTYFHNTSICLPHGLTSKLSSELHGLTLAKLLCGQWNQIKIHEYSSIMFEDNDKVNGDQQYIIQSPQRDQIYPVRYQHRRVGHQAGEGPSEVHQEKREHITFLVSCIWKCENLILSIKSLDRNI